MVWVAMTTLLKVGEVYDFVYDNKNMIRVEELGLLSGEWSS